MMPEIYLSGGNFSPGEETKASGLMNLASLLGSVVMSGTVWWLDRLKTRT